MNLSRFKNLPLRTQFSVLAAVVLAFGAFLAVQGSQQNQENRSKASGTGACNVNSAGDIVGDNCYMPSGFGGSIFGNGNTIGGGMGGSIFGNSNEIFGGLNGCINGNNNIIHGGVNGGVIGTGNVIQGGQGNGPCPDPRFITPTPTSAPTPIPTTRPYGTCADGIDNNQNQLIDRADPICHTDGNKDNFFSYDPYRDETVVPTPPVPTSTPTAPTPTRPPATCADGIDNNQNELIDGQDPACHTDGNQNNNGSYDPHLNEGPVSPTATPAPVGRCKDNIDNDNNGFKDNGDSSCHTDGNPNNPNSYNPNKDGEHGNGNTCADSRDNNNNGLIDGADPICHTDGNPNNPGSYDPNRTEITPTGTPVPTTTPTPTVPVPPGNTSVSLKLLLHGIGKGGDSANPNSGGNANPLHPQRTAKVEIFNSQNTLVLSKEGPISFNSAAGDFTGTVNLGNTLTTGSYIVKVKTSQFLRTIVPGIQTLTIGQVNQLPTTVMVNGDINNDNVLNILDYNLLMGCYSDFSPATDCSAANKLLTDLDDDGDVNQFDYNLFLRELANRQGQ